VPEAIARRFHFINNGAPAFLAAGKAATVERQGDG
jgi:hypothetical protein